MEKKRRKNSVCEEKGLERNVGKRKSEMDRKEREKAKREGVWVREEAVRKGKVSKIRNRVGHLDRDKGGAERSRIGDI